MEVPLLSILHILPQFFQRKFYMSCLKVLQRCVTEASETHDVKPRKTDIHFENMVGTTYFNRFNKSKRMRLRMNAIEIYKPNFHPLFYLR